MIHSSQLPESASGMNNLLSRNRFSFFMPDSGRASVRLPGLCVLLSVAVSLAMIGFVYRDLSPTWDEPSHIGNGIAWFGPAHALIDPVDPPAGRVSAALGPWFFGARGASSVNPYDLGNFVLREGGHYRRTATLARLGILPWYLLAVFLVWKMTRRWLGKWPAALAAVLFIFCPPVLANAGIATTDMPFLAAFLLALDGIWIALREPNGWNYAWAGAGAGLACSAKMSGLPFCFLCAAVFAAYLWWIGRGRARLFPREPRWKLPGARAVVVSLAVMALTIWAAYRFQTGSLATAAGSRASVLRLAAKTGPLRPVVTELVDHMPAYQFLQGVSVARLFTKHPPEGYLFGQTYRHGRTYFFFFMLLVKTPIPLLLLGGAGMWMALRRLPGGSDPFAVVPLAGFFVPMLVATASHVHLGVRHILVCYAFLAMLSALAAVKLAEWKRLSGGAKAAVLGVLIAWSVAGCVAATPDFLAWYNEPAAPYAAYIHDDSDFDWGQDLYRLSAKLRELRADRIWISYNGAIELDQFNLPPWKALERGIPKKGWIAISETNFRTQPQAFGWLSAYQPVAVAGKTIRIYHIE